MVCLVESSRRLGVRRYYDMNVGEQNLNKKIHQMKQYIARMKIKGMTMLLPTMQSDPQVEEGWCHLFTNNVGNECKILKLVNDAIQEGFRTSFTSSTCYFLGDVGKEEDMMVHGFEEQSVAITQLKLKDFAFVYRSNEEWRYAIIVGRSEPKKSPYLFSCWPQKPHQRNSSPPVIWPDVLHNGSKRRLVETKGKDKKIESSRRE